MTNNKTYIYGLVDPRSGLIRYIGKSNKPDKRLGNHINRCNKSISHKNSWIIGLLKNDLRPELIIIDEVDISEWEFWEKHYIKLFKTWGFNLVNSTNGGECGSSDPEVLKRMVETRRKNGSYHLSQETKNKMSQSRTGSGNYFYGRKLSDEHKIKIGIKSLNRGIKEVLEVKDNGMTIWFPSLKDAAKFYKLKDASGITHCCKGRIATSNKSKWKYINIKKEGFVPYDLCPKCKGEGKLLKHDIDGHRIGYNMKMETCDLCGGAMVIPMAVIPDE